MELIQDHLVVNNFQVISSVLSALLTYYSFKQRRYDVFTITSIYSFKGIPNLFPIISPSPIAARFYCCLDMASNLMLLTTFFFLIINISGMVHGVSNKNSALVELETESKNFCSSLKSLILFKATSFYLLFSGLILIPKHTLLPLPGSLVAVSLLSIFSYSMIDTNKFFSDMYFMLYFMELLSCFLLIIVYGFYYQESLMFFFSVTFAIYTYFIDRIGTNNIKKLM